MLAKINLLLLASGLAAVCALTGCQSPKAAAPLGSRAPQSTRNNCYSLLHQLLDQQKHVGLLRFVKREPDDVKILVKKIAAASGAGSKLLEQFAKQDTTINLDDLRLPPGEIGTRDAIAAIRKKELLGQTGNDFELTLLLTQAQALTYACYLARVAGENELHPARARALAGLSAEMNSLYHEVLVLLLAISK